MRAGLILPQGWFGEFADWDPVRAYDHVIEIAQLAAEHGRLLSYRERYGVHSSSQGL